MGRPRKTIQEQDYERIEGMAAVGWREQDIARALGMNHQTWRRIRNEDERAREAWEAGRGKEHQALVGRLFDTAVNGKGKEHVIACIFLLKARHGYREGEVLESSRAPSVTINLPGSLTPDQYQNLIDVTPPKALEGGDA